MDPLTNGMTNAYIWGALVVIALALVALVVKKRA